MALGGTIRRNCISRHLPKGLRLGAFVRAKREKLASLCTVVTNAVRAYPSFLTKRFFFFFYFISRTAYFPLERSVFVMIRRSRDCTQQERNTVGRTSGTKETYRKQVECFLIFYSIYKIIIYTRQYRFCFTLFRVSKLGTKRFTFPPVSWYNGSCTVSLNIVKFNILGPN